MANAKHHEIVECAVGASCGHTVVKSEEIRCRTWAWCRKAVLNDGVTMWASDLVETIAMAPRVGGAGVYAKTTGRHADGSRRRKTTALRRDGKPSTRRVDGDQEAEGGARCCAMRTEERPTNTGSGAPTDGEAITTGCTFGGTPCASAAPALNPGQ